MAKEGLTSFIEKIIIWGPPLNNKSVLTFAQKWHSVSTHSAICHL